MKKLLLAIISLLALESSASEGPSVLVNWGFANKYLAYGSGSVIDKSPAMQTLLAVSYPNGLELSLWNTTNFKRWNSTLGTEVDYGIAWKRKLADYWSLDVGLTYFDEPNVGTLGKGDIAYGHAYLSHDLFEWSLTAGYEKYSVMPGTPFSGGDLYSLGVSRKIALASDQASLSGSAAVVYDTGGFGFDRGYFIRGAISAERKLAKSLTAAVGAEYYIPLTVHDERKNDAVWRISLTKVF